MSWASVIDSIRSSNPISCGIPLPPFPIRSKIGAGRASRQRLSIFAAVTTIAAAALSAQPAEAQSTSGSEVLQACGFGEGWPDGYCLGFTYGTLNAIMFTSAVAAQGIEDEDLRLRFAKTVTGFCLPPEVSPEQTVAVFVRYLETHPERLHLPATPLLKDAFSDAFPC